MSEQKRIEGYSEVVKPEAFRESFEKETDMTLDDLKARWAEAEPVEIADAIKASDIKPVFYGKQED